MPVVRNRGWWWVAIVVVVAALIYAVFGRPHRLQPRLQRLEPADQAVFWATAPTVMVRLDVPAQEAQVTAAVRIQPPVPGRWQAEDQGRVWRFVPAPPGWPRGTQVQVEVGPPLAPQPVRQTFRIRPRMLAYLWPQVGPAQVYAREPRPDAPHQALTRAPAGVLAFAVDPSGPHLVFSAANDQGGADLWWLDLDAGAARRLLACGAAVCDQPAFAPDGRLAFTRDPRGSPRQVMLLPPQASQPTPVPGEGETYGPLWSARGWLAYYDRAGRGYRLWDPAQDITRLVPNDTGEHAAWGAAGHSFYHVELYEVPATVSDIPDPRLSAHLLRYDLETRRQIDLTAAWHWEDATPSADPTGRYLAFARKNLRAEAWTPGRQLWLYDLQRAAAFALTDAPAYNHLGFAWRPDGRALAFVRTHQLDLGAPPELWLYDLDAQHAIRLLEGAYAPQWIP